MNSVNQLDKEGKLIEDLVNPYWDEDEHVCPETIRDLILEAKNDFPNMFEDKYWNRAKDTNVKTFNNDTYNAAVIHWFLKWFGGSS